MAYDVRYCPACASALPLNASRCPCGRAFAADELPILTRPDSLATRQVVTWAFSVLGGCAIGAYAALYYTLPPHRLWRRLGLLDHMMKHDTFAAMGLRFAIAMVLGTLVARVMIWYYVDSRTPRTRLKP